MELGNFQKSVDSDEIKTMAFEIIGEPVVLQFLHPLRQLVENEAVLQEPRFQEPLFLREG